MWNGSDKKWIIQRVVTTQNDINLEIISNQIYIRYTNNISN